MMILQVIGWVLLGLFAVLVLALLIPVHILLRYASDGLHVRVRVLFVTLRLFPAKQRRAKPAKQQNAPEKDGDDTPLQLSSAQPQNSHTQPPPEQKAAPCAPQPSGAEQTNEAAQQETAPVAAAAPREQKKKRKWTLDDVLELVQAGGAGLRVLLRLLRVTQIRLYLPVYGGDADETAKLYGQVHAYIGGAVAVLRNALHLSFTQMDIVPDFNNAHAGQAQFSCRVSGCLLAVAIAAVTGLLRLKQK